MPPRLQREASIKAHSLEKLSVELADRQTANAMDMDYERLRQQLQAARTNLILCSDKLESEWGAWDAEQSRDQEIS